MYFFLSEHVIAGCSIPSAHNCVADFTHPITAVAVTLPGFRGRTTINPADTEQRNTRGKETRARVKQHVLTTDVL